MKTELAKVNRMRDCYTFTIKGKRFTDMTATRVARYLSSVARLLGKDTEFVRITKTSIVLRVIEEPK